MDKINLGDKLPNMLDIHVSLWAKLGGIPLYVIAHKEGWIQHSTKVDLNKTIFALHSKNDYIHTSLINAHSVLFGCPRAMIEGMPVVSIVIVNSRGRKTPEMLQECFNSVRNQSYYNIETIVVDNTDRLITIGKAFNEGVKLAKGEWVLFLGDDDSITPDYVQSLISYIYFGGEAPPIAVSTFLTMFTGNNGTIKTEPRDLVVTGMWKRSYLLEHPCNEFLTRYVDTDMMERAEERKEKMAVLRWHYGYHYRAHPDQVSGFKSLVMQDKYASWRTDEVKEKLMKYKNVTFEVKDVKG
jgi:GT2 family glycosyltransferase